MTQLTTRPRIGRRATDAAELPRRRFTVDEYERMIGAGIIREGERVQLIEGEIVEMAAMHSPHAACVRRTGSWFDRRVGERATVSVQCPIRIAPRNEPEPDIALLRYRSDSYAGAHPEPEDVLLLIEVAHSSLSRDRRRKIPIYARAGIREVWLVDLVAAAITVHRQPAGGRYGEVTVHRRGDSIAPLAFEDLVVGVDDILGV
jgi:Uma2 family endonuclease